MLLPTINTYATETDAMKQIAGRDAAYLYLGDVNSSTIVSSYLMPNPDGLPLTIDHTAAVDWLRGRLDVSDLFTSKLMRLPGDVGLPYWVPDPAFDPAAHVRFHGVTDWSAARDLVADIAATPLDPSRPLWLMHVITDIPDAPDQTGLSTLVALHYHHAAFDGMLFSTLTATMFSDLEITDEVRAAGRIVGGAEKTRAAVARRELVGLPGHFWRFARVCGTTIRRTREKAKTSEPGIRRSWPVIRFNAPFRGPRIADGVMLDLQEVLELRSRVPGATLNDLMLSVIGEATNRYLTQAGERPESSMSALVPMSTRAMRESASANQFVPMVVDLQTAESDLTTRVRLISAETSREKKRIAEEATRADIAVVDAMPAPLLRLLGVLSRRQSKSASTAPAFNIVVTNVNGVQMRRKIFGLEVVGGFGVQTVASGSTLAHVMTNRADKLAVSITADRASLPDITEYCRIIEQSFKTHQAEVG